LGFSECGYAMLDDQNEIAEVVISFIDISERKEMEVEIRAAQVQAESTNRAKQISANMSHEIGTPLNGIIVKWRNETHKDTDNFLVTVG
jgi:signal transduction histidine kinase